jgi:DNA-binding response OmpR family regulator
MKRRILLVDDEVAILLTLQAVLEINGFEVETAASAREAKLKIRNHQYHMVITDLRMESDTAGSEVILAARKAPYSPAVAMLTAFPMPGSEGDKHDADEVLVKPMHTKDLLLQIEALLVSHEDKKRFEQEHTLPTPKAPKASGVRKLPAAKKASVAKKASAAKKASVAKKTPAAKKSPGAKKAAAKKAPAAKPKTLKPAKVL